MNENNENQNVVPTGNQQIQNQINNGESVIPQNTIPVNQNIGIGVSTAAPQPQVGQPVPTTVAPQQTEIKKDILPENNEPPKKEGVFKYVILFIFLILFTGFVLFIPEISKIVKSKLKKTENITENVVEKGTLTCSKDKSSDETDTVYELKFIFDNKKLLTSKYVTTYESLDSEFLAKKGEECTFISQTSKQIAGIDTNCNDKNGILKITEEYTNQDIDKKNLTPYTEAGGTYPEFEYGENVYDIQTKLVKEGYDCKVSSVQE